MPRIKLSRNPATRLDFLAHVFWPKDEEKRKAYIALTNEASFAYLAEAQEKSMIQSIFVEGHYDAWAKSVREQFADEVIDSDETAKSVSLGYGLHSLGTEIHKNAANVFLTGYTILVLTTMIQHHAEDERLRGGPGIKKAQEVVADIQLIALSRVENAWAKYKTVAHFCTAAVVLAGLEISAMIELFLRPTAEFISASQYYRLLLTTFKPQRRNVPLVSENELWLPPTEWECNGTKLVGPPLPEALLNALGERKAR